MNHKAELLAPAGSYESLIAAIHAGADAVYLGGSRYGARAYANNLGEEELCRAIEFAHVHGRKLYLTVNTLMKDRELEELGDYLLPYYECGLDAVIVQDLGVFSYIRDCFPDLPIHASTQMTVLGPDGAAFLKKLGAARVVTARELSLEEIRQIHREADIEIESFIHGALCYCYSGQCLFSSMLGGRSGNRGRCAQPCRLPYQLKYKGNIINSKEEAYLLSPKDMCTIELLPEILEAGVYSLKIEGRMKRPEYTAGVVRIYRKYLDAYLENGAGRYQVSREDYQELQTLYNRGGFSQGYYKMQNGRSMISLVRPNHFEKTHAKQALLEKQTYDALLNLLKKEYIDTGKKEKIHGIFKVSTKFPTKFVVQCREAKIVVTGEPAQIPQKQPMSREAITRQLQKTGETPFTFDTLEIKLEEEVFLPVQQLNRMRREALGKLVEELAGQGKRKLSEEFMVHSPLSEKAPKGKRARDKKYFIHVQLDQPEYLCEVLKFPEVSKVYLTSEQTDFKKLAHYVEDCHRAGKGCALVLPAIFRLTARAYFLERLELLKSVSLDAVVVKNLDELEFLQKYHWEVPIILDHNLYTFNRESLEFWKKSGYSRRILYDTLPLELNERELHARGCTESEMLVYGHVPFMVTAGCLHQTMGRCDRKQEAWILTDRYQKEFPVINYCRYCYNVIYNCEPLSLLGSKEAVDGIGPNSLRLCFTMENREQTFQTLRRFVEIYCHNKPFEGMGESFTKGHLKRGVE
ncbi:MAG: U32 family peptidase [Lachnospiraceae bacterium]|nr:U32 family peptidase [Lachnospiraceae bacterium]